MTNAHHKLTDHKVMSSYCLFGLTHIQKTQMYSVYIYLKQIKAAN